MSDRIETDDRIDISEHTNALCEAFGLEPRLVKRMNIGPNEVDVLVYETNERGEKFIRQDGYVALSECNYRVRT